MLDPAYLTSIWSRQLWKYLDECAPCCAIMSPQDDQETPVIIQRTEEDCDDIELATSTEALKQHATLNSIKSQ